MGSSPTARSATPFGGWPRLTLFGGACAAGAAVGNWLSVEVAGQPVPALWVPIGILAAALIASPRREWRTLVIVAAGATLVAGPLSPGGLRLAHIGQQLIYTLQGVAVVWLIRRRVERPFTLAWTADVGLLVVLAALVPLAGGGIAMVVGRPAGSVWTAWGIGWLASTLGLLAVTPIVCAWSVWSDDRPRRPVPHALLEHLAVLAGSALITYAVFSDSFPSAVRAPAYLLPFLLWAAFRTGPGGAASTMLGICLIALWHTTQGRGPFTLPSQDLPASVAVLRSQGAAAAVGASILLLATVVAERKRLSDERDAVLADLRAALTEIKTLQGMIPICAWCHKVRDDAGFWQGIEDYVSTHTEATLSHGICPECSSRVHTTLETPPADGPG